jgi:ElaB/YqjD/DUF883 family membrane-anchored ribosome-binding protein
MRCEIGFRGTYTVLPAFERRSTNVNSIEGCTMGATTNGDSPTNDTAEIKEHLRAASDAAASAARARAARAQEWARDRASRAQGWARDQWGDMQQSIEAQPYKAAALALGIGLLAGILLTTLATRRPSSD